MAKRLSRVLVEHRMVDIATMERGFRHKDQAGGRLGTNLLEMGAIDEDTLLQALSISRQLPIPPAELLEAIDPTAVHYLNVDDAVNFGVIPIAVRGEELVVVIKDPLGPERMALLSERTGHSLLPHIITDLRFEQILSMLYGLPLSRRFQQLIDRFPRRIGLAQPAIVEEERDTLEIPVVSVPPGEIEVAEGPGERVTERISLVPVSEAAEEPVEAPEMETARMVGAPPSPAVAPTEPESLGIAVPPGEALSVEWEETEAEAAEGEVAEPGESMELAPVEPGWEQAVPGIPSVEAEVQPAEHAAEEMVSAQWVEPTELAPLEEAEEAGVELEAEPVPESAEPQALALELPEDLETLGVDWSSQQLGQFLESCQDRDLIIQALQGFIGNHCPRRCLLAVHKRQLRGFSQKGFTGPSDLIRSIQIEAEPIFAKIQTEWGPTTAIGTPHDLGLIPLYRTYEAAVPPEVVVGVIRIRQRPVLVWTADNGLHPIPRTAMPSLEKATGQVASALAQLVFRQKRSGQTPREQLRFIEVATTRPGIPRRVMERTPDRGPEEKAVRSRSASKPEFDRQAIIETAPRAPTRRPEALSRGIEATSAAPLVPPSPFTAEELQHIEEHPLRPESALSIAAPGPPPSRQAPAPESEAVSPPQPEESLVEMEATQPFRVMRPEAASEELEEPETSRSPQRAVSTAERRDRELFGEIEQFIRDQEAMLTPHGLASVTSPAGQVPAAEVETAVLQPEGLPGVELDALDALDEWTDQDLPLERRDTTLPGVGGMPMTSPPVRRSHSQVIAEEELPYIYPTPVKIDSREIAVREPTALVPQRGEEVAATEPDRGRTEAAQILDALVSEDRTSALRAKAELLLAGEEVLDELSERFPGPVTAEPGLPNSPLFASEYGPLLATAIELGPRFVGRLVELLNSKRRDQRLYGTLCAQDLLHSKLLHPLIERLFDSDPVIRKIACDALDGYRSHAQFLDVFLSLRKGLVESNVNQQAAAAEAIGILFDEESIPYLIELVGSKSVRVAGAAQTALERMVFQSFGSDKGRWLRWYQKNGMQSRDEWLVEGVFHRDERIRALVSEFIRRMPDLQLEFDPQGGRREQKRVQEELRRHFSPGRVPRG